MAAPHTRPAGGMARWLRWLIGVALVWLILAYPSDAAQLTRALVDAAMGLMSAVTRSVADFFRGVG